MTKLIFVAPDGAETAVDYTAGGSLMEAAIANDIQGIEAQCYGAAVCGTCHVYVDVRWSVAAGTCSEWEQEMLDALSLAREDSRLACQINVTDALEGARFSLPVSQETLE